MNGTGIESIVRAVVAGIFGIAALSFVAKDGGEMGKFLTATGTAFGSFAKSVQAT